MTKIANRFGVLLAAAAFGLVLQAGAAQAQGSTSGPSTPFYGSDFGYTPPPVVKPPEPPRVGTPQRNMPMPEVVRAPNIPGSQVSTVAQPRRVPLNRLENRLTTEQVRATGNAAANLQNRPTGGSQLLETAKPIL